MAKKFKDLAGACWKGYKAVGLKDKNGRKVPNCVPEEVQLEGKRDEEETVDREDRADYKLSPSGRKTHKQIVFKMGEEDLKEGTVSKKDYSWGKMMTVHHGKDISYPLHPEHQKIVKDLRPSGEHSKAMYKDETGNQVHVTREGDKVHFVSHRTSGSKKTTVDYKHFDESVPAKNTDVSDKSWLKDAGKKPTIKSDLKNFKNFLTGKKETNEEVEISEAAPFKTKEDAVKYAKEKVKTHRDNLDGIEIYAHSGGFDVNHTANSSGRNSLQKVGAKHIGTIYKEEVEQVEEGWYEKPASAYRRKGDEVRDKAPVAPVPDKKYIKGTPENKAYKATKKPINGMPTNEEVEQIDEVTHEVGISYDKNAMRAQGKVRVAAKDHDEARTKALDSMKGREKNVKAHTSRNLAKGKETDTAKFNEETLDEVLTPSMGAGKYVKDFQKSDAPQFEGKSKKKRQEMAIAAYLQAKREMKEETKYVVHYTNEKGEHVNSSKAFDDKDKAHAHAAKGNAMDKVGGKYTVKAIQNEELKGNQHKLDKNKNGKLDKQDFKLIRKEETEQVDEGILKGTAEVVKQAVKVPYRAAKRVVKGVLAAAGGVADTVKDVGDAAKNIKKKFKEDFDENGELTTNMKSYKEFVQSLDEIKMSDLPSRKVSGKYGTEYYKGEAEADKKGYDDEDKPAKPAGEKRGRGRPAGSTSGARQKGTIAKRKGSGVEMTGYPVHLPNFK